MKIKHAVTLFVLLGSFATLSACGRSTAEIYRAYNLTAVSNAKGQATQDLASQNRLSLQTGSENTYFYSVPVHEDFINPDEKKLLDAQKAAQADQTSTESDDESSDESSEDSNAESENLDDTALPDDAPADAIAGKIDALKSDIKEALE